MMIEWFARNGVAANLLMVLILVVGIHALAFRLPPEVFPDIDMEVVNISMVFRGATPLEVEESIVMRIEEAIADLSGIDRIISNAREGGAEIQVEVERGHDARALLDDIKNRMDAINTFPADAESPVYSIPQRRFQVIGVVISGVLSEGSLRKLGERVRDDLLALPGVSHVDLMGARAPEIAIEVSQYTLERFGLGFDDITRAIRNNSGDYPAGSLKTHRGEILLRTKGQRYTGDDFARIPVIDHPDGTHLTLADIAEIRDGFVEDPLYARFNGQPAVLLPVFRTHGQSAIALAREVRGYVESTHRRLPPGITMDCWFDTSREISIWLDMLLTNAAQGGIIVLLILALFLRLSVALLIFVGIPVSFMGALATMPELGATVNVITLFSFILVLGIVVDDAIVTGENIYSHLRRGKEPTLAAIRGTHEMAIPVTLGVLTTMTAFTPLLLMEGERGIIFGQIAVVVMLVLFFSLVESKLILPAHMAHLRGITDGKRRGNRLARMQDRIVVSLEWGTRHFYRPLLARALENRFLTIALFVGISFVLVSFVLSGRYAFVFFPEVETDIAWATLEMPAGTSFHVMDRHLSHIARAAHGLREKYRNADTGEGVIRNILVERGWSFLTGAGDAGPHTGEVVLELAPPTERPVPVANATLIREWREATGPIPGARELGFYFDEEQIGNPIDIQLAGDDFEALTAAAMAIEERLAEYPGVFNIQDSLDVGREEITLKLRPEAELLGLSVADLGRQVRQAFFGAEAERFQRGRDDVRVMVRYPLAERRTMVNLLQMKIRTPLGVEVPFGSVADVTVGGAFSTIRRVDRHRAIDVTADIDRQNTDVNRIVTDMAPFLVDLEARWSGVRHSLEGELREQRESFGNLYVGVVFIFFALYALLAIPLRSYLQPLIIMGVIPFSVVGAIFGHMIMGLELSMMSVMGLLALAGVVINDNLVLLDYINRRRHEGVAVMAAVRIAGVARFRPILLTSLTTFTGLMPLIFEDSSQAQYLIPMAVSLGFGILYATLLTLFLVPISYTFLSDMDRFQY
uniref:Multidrug efflux pump subunit AcrB n=1 Tax=Candidatus Kentrum sp. FW TaxID=2126338 RepID=A0A450U479_9GAMM|nr:MAG: Multidrug efflux pump subunit AcrB [Candidatus Kentron sp. FW]